MSTRPLLLFAAVAAVLLTACTRAATAQSPEPIAPRDGVTVSGVGQVSGRPDVLRATLGVSVQRASVQEALNDANAAAEAVLAALREAGVAEDDIQTRQFSVHPQFTHPRDGEPVIDGYVVENLVEAKLRDLDQIGATLSAAIEAGGDAARVQQVGFFLEDNAALLEQARAQAFADAREKAEQYAELSDRELGALVSVTETTGAPPPPVMFDERAVEETAAAAVPIAPGTSEVSVTVTTLWAFE